MAQIKFIENPNESFKEIEELSHIIYNGFMALAMDYGYHINNAFGQVKDGKQQIYEIRDNINYRINAAKFHFQILLAQKIKIEQRFSKMLKENPKVFSGFFIGNPHFEFASEEIMSIYDSLIFHLSSSFDYLAMLTQFIFGKNPQTNLQWITLVKHSYNNTSEFSNRVFIENIKKADAEFVSKFNDYRAELIHRKKSESFASVTWELNSGNVVTQFKCSDKIKSNLKKIIDKDLEYCISYASFTLIKQSLIKIGYVLEGMNDEFRKNYNPHNPFMNNGGFQIISLNSETNFADSPSLQYWKSFMEYKNFC